MEIRLDGVRFRRGKRLVLDVPGLVIASDRVTAILGPNGSGKTTLLRLVAGLERPDEGRITIGGRPTGDPRFVAYVFQEAVFVSGTVRANLDLALRLRHFAAAERAERVAEAARECGVFELLERRANALSGGEAQRANLARALALRAPVTLLDEPLAGLDAPTRAALLADLPGLLASFATTTVLVTHDRDEAFRLAGDLVLLDEGRLLAAGRAADLWQKPPSPKAASLLGYALLPAGGELAGVPPGALRACPGEIEFEAVADTVLEGPGGHRLLGRIGTAVVEAAVPAGQPSPLPGARVTLSARAGDVQRWPIDDVNRAARRIPIDRRSAPP